MLLEIDPGTSLNSLSAKIAGHGVARDRDGGFPVEAFAHLADEGVLAAPPSEMRSLLSLLAAVGRGDLSVGRIFEGHVNAVYLIQKYAWQAQRMHLEKTARQGGIFGVWNTDSPGEPLRIEADMFVGKKAFASGIDGLSHAIVTVGDRSGRQMYVVPTEKLGVDRSWWRPLGMRASGSHVADFTGIPVQPEWRLGGMDAYLAQPWFSAGAIRFLAVQVGGMHAVLDTTTQHLNETERAANPYQAHRLARLGVAVETGYLWLERVAQAWSDVSAERMEQPSARYLVASANGARVAIEEAALTVLEEAERAIGAAGMIAPHPFERLMRDLRTYLRQPNPDGAAAAFGASIAASDWTPSGQRFDDGTP